MTARITLSKIPVRRSWTAHVAVGGSGLPPALQSFEFPDPSQWSALLEALVDGKVPAEQVDVLKESTGGRVWRVRWDLPNGLRTIICRSWPPVTPIIRILGRWLRANAGHLHWRKAIRLIDAGVHTALPLVLCEPKSGPDDTWLITTDVLDGVDLDTIVLTELPRLDRGVMIAAKRRLTEPIVDLLVRLCQAGIYHRDLKASNLLLTNWLSSPRVWIVDVEGVRLLGWRRWWFPLVRLASSLLSYRSVTRTDYIRFLRAYLKRIDPRNDDWHGYFSTLSRQAQGYHQSAKRRKPSKLDGFDED